MNWWKPPQGLGAFVKAEPGKALFRPESGKASHGELRHIFRLRIAVEGAAAALADRASFQDAASTAPQWKPRRSRRLGFHYRAAWMDLRVSAQGWETLAPFC